MLTNIGIYINNINSFKMDTMIFARNFKWFPVVCHYLILTNKPAVCLRETKKHAIFPLKVPRAPFLIGMRPDYSLNWLEREN